MEQASGYVESSGLTQAEKDYLGGLLLADTADESLARRINLIHSDGALKELIRIKQSLPGNVFLLLTKLF